MELLKNGNNKRKVRSSILCRGMIYYLILDWTIGNRTEDGNTYHTTRNGRHVSH